MHKRKWLVLTAVMSLVILLAGSSMATVHNINVGTFFFSPTKTNIVPGDTVRWHALVGGLHTTTSDASSFKSWNSGIFALAGDSFDVVFNLSDGPGPFAYHCAIHPAAMKDTIFVTYSSHVHQIQVLDSAYVPAKTHIVPGDTVIWAWKNGIHNTISDGSSFKSWASGTLQQAGDFFMVAFDYADAPGPFPYHCSFHPFTMKDTLFMDISSATHVVRISDFSYTPAKTHINLGDTVMWVWQSGTHTSTSDPSSPKNWFSPTIAGPSDHFRVVFNPIDGNGPFPYHCEIHTSMMDTIFVNTAPTCFCGDANGDNFVNISDAVFLIQYIFAGGGAPNPICHGDANGDNTVNISDAVFLIQFIFSGGASPHCP